MKHFDYQQILFLYTYGILEELKRLEINTLIISPGARSTPLTTVAATHTGLEKIVAYDERGAAFMALGMAKAKGKPVVLISTSGTAVANYLPASVEAKMSGVPLIFLTADRPADLRNSGANQTILQPGIFSHYVKESVDLPVPGGDTTGEFILSVIDELVFAAVSEVPGPVHINCQFEKPLEPIPVDSGQFPLFFPNQWLQTDQPYTVFSENLSGSAEDTASEIAKILENAKKPFLFFGDLKNPFQPIRLQSSNQPFTVDSTQASVIRSDSYFSLLDLALVNPEFKKNFHPDVWIQVGSRPTSSRIEQFLKQNPFSEMIHIHTMKMNSDPAKKVTIQKIIESEHLLDIIEQMFKIQAPESWMKWLQKVHFRISKVVDQFFDQELPLNQWQVYKRLKQLIPVTHNLFLGNSMAVRLPEILGEQEFNGSVFTNRGVSGIDGLIATVSGIACGQQKPVTAILGDLAFHHDMNSLDLLRYAKNQVVFLILNNHGGGIFHFLPVAEQQNVFEKYFGTPHRYHFQHVAQHFGLIYKKADRNPEQLGEYYTQAIQDGKHTIIEIELDRFRDKEIFDRLTEKIRKIKF
jgi:2-succinyl-5-enolpyruvyl-6-hydroxy-3-cyclohexene-1-carboxylate synthase